MGKSTINHIFSIAKLKYQRVTVISMEWMIAPKTEVIYHENSYFNGIMEWHNFYNWGEIHHEINPLMTVSWAIAVSKPKPWVNGVSMRYMCLFCVFLVVYNHELSEVFTVITMRM